MFEFNHLFAKAFSSPVYSAQIRDLHSLIVFLNLNWFFISCKVCSNLSVLTKLKITVQSSDQVQNVTAECTQV